MTEVFAKITLGPLLLMQGLYTRWVTPRLPEAQGERQGVSGSGPALRVLILGDSAAAGVGVASQDEALAGRLVSRLAEDFQVSWKLLAEPGLDTQEVVQMLERSSAERFDVVVVSVGVNDVNDVTGGIGARDWIAQQGRLIDLLCWKFGASQVLLSTIAPMHLFPALPQPLRWYLGGRATCFNNHLAELVRCRNQCTLLATQFLPVAGLMAADGFHPGPPIYALWADDAAAAIRRRFAVPRQGGRLQEEAR